MVSGPTSRAVGRLKEEEDDDDDDEIVVCQFPYLPLMDCSNDAGILKDHSRNTVSYQKTL